MEYQIVDFMHLKQERKGFVVDRPNGTDEFVFIHFINPVDIRIYDQIITTLPHACILYSPHSPCCYTSSTFDMLHDWIHFLPLSSEYNPLYLGVPLNKLFYTEFGSNITKHMETIQWLYNQNAIIEMSKELLEIFTLLSDEQNQHNKSKMQTDKDIFEKLRMLIYQTPKNWNVNTMAQYTHLSRSWFSVKYKSIFGVSPLDDLNNATMCMAKKLLLTTSLTIQNIALECGYQNVAYFIQHFKKQTGQTPAVWRDRITRNNIK